jgi:hypothetical protein
MSYSIIHQSNILLKENYWEYKLCYIEEISETIFDYDERSKKYMSRPGFSMKEEMDKYNYHSPNLITIEIPNPEYIEGESTHYAYFTPIDFSEQWGDDWDDAPYEHNAGRPYDHGSNHRDEVEIIMIPFGIKNETAWIKFPDYYGCGNSPFSVDEINLGAVPWIFAKGKRRSGVSIYGGDSVLTFLDKLKQIENL